MIDNLEFVMQSLAATLVVGLASTPMRRKERLRDDASLCDAASVGDRRRVKKLLTEGANPDSSDEEGNTALMAAAFAGQVGVVEDLLEAGADPDIQDVFGVTALMNAVIAIGDLEIGEVHPVYGEIVQLLMDNGADVDLEDEDGTSALDIATSLDIDELIELLQA